MQARFSKREVTKRVIKLIISVVFWLLTSLYRWIEALFGIERAGTCVVLYYHVVLPEEREKFAYQMDVLLRLAKPISLSAPILLEPGRHHVAVTFDDAFRESLVNVLPDLEKRNIPITVFVPTGCTGLPASWLIGNEYATDRDVVMSAGELEEFGKHPLVSLGSHCITHRPLPALPNPEAKTEIFQSKLDLEAILGTGVNTLSFPHGAFEQRHSDWAKQAGYTRVFSISPVFAFINPDEFVTGRVRVDPSHWRLEFRLKIAGAYRWLPVPRRPWKLRGAAS
jgi:peptidoglycan/xylan/chitin deacetylase (PgdA/CDA1 family)